MSPHDQLIEAFIQSTRRVMKTMCGETDIKHEILAEPPETSNGDIIGVMGLGGSISGTTIMVAFPAELARTILSMMTGFERDKLSYTAINDGIAEFLNVICGAAKNILSDSDYSFSLSVPMIFTSQECRIGCHRDVSVYGLRFGILGEYFNLQICLAARQLNPAPQPS